jgi:hypothetical protein
VIGRKAIVRRSPGGKINLSSRRRAARSPALPESEAKIGALNRDLFRSRSEILRRYGVSAQQLLRWRRLRRDPFPAPIKVGSGWFYPLCGILSWERPRSRLRGLFLGRPR